MLSIVSCIVIYYISIEIKVKKFNIARVQMVASSSTGILCTYVALLENFWPKTEPWIRTFFGYSRVHGYFCPRQVHLKSRICFSNFLYVKWKENDRVDKVAFVKHVLKGKPARHQSCSKHLSEKMSKVCSNAYWFIEGNKSLSGRRQYLQYEYNFRSLLQ